MRGRQFQHAVSHLAAWWYREFDVRDGPKLNVRSQTFSEVQHELAQESTAKPGPSSDRKGKGKAKRTAQDDDHGEVIRSEKSLMKHALMKRGSRDISAQLFTSLCRALGIPARLVVSLQSVPWRSSVGKSNKAKTPAKKPDVSGKGKEKEVVQSGGDDEDSSDSMEEVIGSPSLRSFAFDGKASSSGTPTNSPSGRGQTLSGKLGPQKPTPKPIIRLRKMKAMGGRRLGSGDSTPTSSRQSEPPTDGWPPVFWTEVFSRPDGCWIPVDVSRNIVQKKSTFEPPPNDRNNRMVYVVALEEGMSAIICIKRLLTVLNWFRRLCTGCHPSVRQGVRR